MDQAPRSTLKAASRRNNHRPCETSLRQPQTGITDLLDNRLEPVQAGAIVAVNFILHFHIGVAEQEASIILGNASLSQAITNGVAEGVKVHALAHDAKTLARRLGRAAAGDAN
jgi:hypothetical protein